MRQVSGRPLDVRKPGLAQETDAVYTLQSYV